MWRAGSPSSLRRYAALSASPIGVNRDAALACGGDCMAACGVDSSHESCERVWPWVWAGNTPLYALRVCPLRAQNRADLFSVEGCTSPRPVGAHYAMVWAVQAALVHRGIKRSEWSHPALQASFVTGLIRRRKQYPGLLGQRFNRAL